MRALVIEKRVQNLVRLTACVPAMLRTDLPGAHQTDICMTCRLWVLLVCLNGMAASPQNYTHPKVVAVRGRIRESRLRIASGQSAVWHGA